MLGEALLESGLEQVTQLLGPCDQTFVAEDAEYFGGCGARRGVGTEGVEHYGHVSRGNCLGNVVAGENPDDRCIAARQAFAGDQQVGFDVPVLMAEAFAGATEAGHHFIHDQQNAVLVAECPHTGPIVVRWDDRATARAGDWFRQKCRYSFRAELLQPFFQRAEVEGSSVGMVWSERTAQRIGRSHAGVVRERVSQAFFARFMTAHGGGCEGGSVIGDVAPDDGSSLRFAARCLILQRDLHCALNPLGAAAGKVGTAQRRRQPVGAQPFHQSGARWCQPRRHDVGRGRGCFRDRFRDTCAAVTHVDHDRPAGRVENPTAVRAFQISTLGANDGQVANRGDEWPGNFGCAVHLIGYSR